MTTFGKILVVSQFILSLAFAIVAGLFLAHRLPWNTPSASSGAPAPGLIEEHQKKIKDLVVAHDRAIARWNAYYSDLLALEAERPIRQALYTQKLNTLRTSKDPGAVTAVEYDPAATIALKTMEPLKPGRLKIAGATPIPYRGNNTQALDAIVAEIHRLYRDNNIVGPIPDTQKRIAGLLTQYDKLTIDIKGGGAVRGLLEEIRLQEVLAKSLVKEQEDLKPALANRYAEVVLVLQRQNSLLSRKQELQKIGVASGTTP